MALLFDIILVSPIFKLEDFKKDIFSKGIFPKIFFTNFSSKLTNQSLKPGIGDNVPKFLIFGSSSCISKTTLLIKKFPKVTLDNPSWQLLIE